MGAIRQWWWRRFSRDGVDLVWEAEFKKHGGHTYRDRYDRFDGSMATRGRKRADELHRAVMKAAASSSYDNIDTRHGSVVSIRGRHT